READGLALSSRNVYLSPEERRDAVLLSAGLQAAQETFSRGERSADRLMAAARDVLDRGQQVRVQYLELVDAETLDPADPAEPGNVMAVAAYVGGTRLI